MTRDPAVVNRDDLIGHMRVMNEQKKTNVTVTRIAIHSHRNHIPRTAETVARYHLLFLTSPQVSHLISFESPAVAATFSRLISAYGHTASLLPPLPPGGSTSDIRVT